MKKDIKNISYFLSRFIIMTGLVIGFLALTTTTPLPSELAQEQGKEQNTGEENEKEAQEVLKAFEAINSTAQISLDHQYLLLETLPSFITKKDEEVPSDSELFLGGSKVLKILFRRIISPNAP